MEQRQQILATEAATKFAAGEITEIEAIRILADGNADMEAELTTTFFERMMAA